MPLEEHNIPSLRFLPQVHKPRGNIRQADTEGQSTQEVACTLQKVPWGPKARRVGAPSPFSCVSVIPRACVCLAHGQAPSTSDNAWQVARGQEMFVG